MLPVPHRPRHHTFAASSSPARSSARPSPRRRRRPAHHGADVPELAWTDCGDGLQCATASVPLDHDRPGASTSRCRWPACRRRDQAHRIGTLFVNNGGPGNSVIDFMHGDVHDVVPAAVQARFDIVGFDPRGVGESTPVRCFADPRGAAGVLRRAAAVPGHARRGRPRPPRRPAELGRALRAAQRRAPRPRRDGRRRPRPRPAPPGRRRRAADVRRLLVRRPDRHDVRPAVPGSGCGPPCSTARPIPWPGRPGRVPTAASRSASASTATRRRATRSASSSTPARPPEPSGCAFAAADTRAKFDAPDGPSCSTVRSSSTSRPARPGPVARPRSRTPSSSTACAAGCSSRRSGATSPVSCR